MTKFSEQHMGNSPVKQIAGDRAGRLRKRAQRRSERSGETGDYDYSDMKVLKLLNKAKKIENKNFIKSTGAKKGSKRKGSRYGEDSRVSASYERPDMDPSPLNQGGYVGGGMSASDYAPTADLYMNMFQGITEGAKKFDEAYYNPETQAERLKNRIERRKKRAQRISERSGETGGYDYENPKVNKLLDTKSLEDKKQKALAKAEKNKYSEQEKYYRELGKKVHEAGYDK